MDILNASKDIQKGNLMTEAEKKTLYDKSYKKWLKYCKNEFKYYCSDSKISLEAKQKFMEHLRGLFDVMKSCGVCMYSEKGPMGDIAEIMLKFKEEGNPDSLRDLLISTKSSCWRSVIFEKTPEEIESEAKRMAQMDVEHAEWKEEEDRKEAEKRRKEQEEWEARNKKKEERLAKIRKANEEWAAKHETDKKTLRSWREMMEVLLDDIRKGQKHWYADEELTEPEFAAVKMYVDTLFKFTEAQNMGFTGIALYSHNEARAAAHETMLDMFDLLNSEYAKEITKSYDFSDDYDYRTQTYKHLPEDTVVNLLGFAMVEARKAEKEDTCI